MRWLPTSRRCARSLPRPKTAGVTSGRKTILFIDEIHRFNKAQQDVLMPDIEEGNIILIGATVFNPFFALVSPLLSRSLIFELQSLSPDDLMVLMRRALADKERGLGALPVKMEDKALEFLSTISDGDGRKALNALEVAVLTTPKSKDGSIHITMDDRRRIHPEKTGEL